jgi:hypothetical protein
MQTSVKKALLRKFLLHQCRKQSRHPLPLQALSPTITRPPTLHPQPKQIEIHNTNHNDLLVTER